MIKLLSLFIVSIALRCDSKTQEKPKDNVTINVMSVAWLGSSNNLLFNILQMDKVEMTKSKMGVFIYNALENKLSLLIPEALAPSVSSDGRKIVYTTDPGPNKKSDILIYDKDTKSTVTVLADSAINIYPQWSPNGKYIAYNVENKDRGLDIYVMDIITHETLKIVESGKRRSWSPVWSPDGNLIVYYFETGNKHDQIYLTDRKGSFHTNLTNDSMAHTFYPSWMTESKIIYTLAPNSIMTMDIKSGSRHQIEGVNAFFAQYNPALMKIVCKSKDGKVFIYDMKTKASTPILEQINTATLFK